MKKIAVIMFAAFMGAFVALGGAYLLMFGKNDFVQPQSTSFPAKMVNMPVIAPGDAPVMDFTFAAEQTLPAVVHIQSTSKVRQRGGNRQDFDLQQIPEQFRDFFENPFGGQQGPKEQLRQGSGSGVIIATDGYIVTNNHVVANADELMVTLNDHRNYTATVIGMDPSTDIALIKIDENNLPVVQFTSSDAIRVGQWVVAVGNPFNLESTVTAGIVSAKGRSINIMQDKTPIESFIQTDAAINPGNSGGALVNLKGELVGINTAIASPTGSYTGYGFAVPSNIVIKIISDLKDFGVVQRGFIGAMIRSIDGNFAKEKGLTTTRGVYVESLADNSAAEEAGIKAGDVIVAVDGLPTVTSPKLLEMIGRHRPGDKVPVTILRNGNEKEMIVTLKNSSGNTDTVKKDKKAPVLDLLGASFEPLSKKEAAKMGLSGGLQLVELRAGQLARQTDIQEGFIVTKVDGKKIESIEGLDRLLKDKKGGVMMEGRYPDSDQVYYYAFGL